MHDPNTTLAVIRRAVKENGWPPSLAELAALTGRSTMAVRYDLGILEGRGDIERGRGARQIRLTAAPVGGAA